MAVGAQNSKPQVFLIITQEYRHFLQPPINTRHAEGWVSDLGKLKRSPL